MNRNFSLYTSLCLVALLLFLHLLAIKFYFYWTLWWSDVLAHFLAGLAIAFAVYWVLFVSKIFFKREIGLFKTLVIVCSILLVIGVAWEIFEYVNGFIDSQEGYILDTFNDLVLDVSGAASAVLIMAERRSKLKK